MTAVGAPLSLSARTVSAAELKPGEVVVRVAGCGVCHTDLGFFYDGVRTGKPLPLALGHEISGVVELAGEALEHLVGRSVVVPAVIPCGHCALCAKGRGSICREQLFPGSHVDGGFASHVVLPGADLCVVDDARLAASGLELADLCVIADAISTPYQAVLRAGVGPGDLAIFIGVGGVGGFGVQLAHALGATVVALDVNAERLQALAAYGADLTLNVAGEDQKELRKRIGAFAKERGLPAVEWKIFETSGKAAGQDLAFSLLTFGSTLSVIGFTLDKVNLRLSNLMAFDAVAMGNWGCLPEHYPGALELVLGGGVKLAPFVERRPMSTINAVFDEVHRGALRKRPVLIPDFS